VNRSEAIGQVISWIHDIDQEWGPTDRVDEDAAEVLTALGVTEDELIAHGVIKGGYYYHLFVKVAGLLAEGRDREAVREIAVAYGPRDPGGQQVRTALFKRSEPVGEEAA
jgi:hypothetical protein